MKDKLYIYKSKTILAMSIIFLLLSVVLATNEALGLNIDMTSINISQMSQAANMIKSGSASKSTKLIEVKNSEKVQNNQNTQVKNVSNPVNTRIFYLPTEYGRITTYPSYYHMAYDITSPRGSSEIIYPIAQGIISSIYTDGAGALIVTVRHIINGQYYTSQYVHLSRYANIYVGEEITPFTPLGWMGTTGNSTGVHLHVAVVDCNLFGYNDACSDLNGFFRYGRIRYNQGYMGLGSLIYVPYEWYSR